LAAPAPPTTDELFGAQDEGKPALPPEGTDSERSQVDSPAIDATAESVLPTPPEETMDQPPTTGDTATEPTVVATPEQRRLVWRAASKWSLAAAIHAKGLDASRYEPILAEAAAATRELGIELPPLPTASQPGDREGAVIEGLRGESAVTLMNALANQFGPAESAAADLAIRSHMLLLTYSPRSADAEMQVEALRRAGEASDISSEAWAPLVELLEQRAPFVDVRQAVFDLDRRATAFLSSEMNGSE
jgi:hypothetical protein